MDRTTRLAGFLLLFAAWISPPSSAATPSYVGPDTCALCHKDIAAEQSRTAMANTWQGRLTSWLPERFHAFAQDDPSYEVNRGNGVITYLLRAPTGQNLKYPVDILMGGQRHGIGFLTRIRQFEGIPLARPVLVQARYAWSPEKKQLVIAPGCSTARAESLESALGLALSPTFESRCLGCHGQPAISGSGKTGGVHCEACHGAGSEHLAAVGRGLPSHGILNPKRLSNEDSIAVCAACHVGLTRFSDPSPGDLLIANQAGAIRNSECFLQSGKAFSCITCHDPHNGADDSDRRAIQACLGCHSAQAKPHAGICPVNSREDCISCHMPSIEMGPLHLVDHSIRVHPNESNAAKPNASYRSQIRPVSEYLRTITAASAEAAACASERLLRGESFYKVARDVSIDPAAAIGGYIGRKTLAELGRDLSGEAERLGYGEIGRSIQVGGRWIILQRLPRDFRWDAEQLEGQAEELAARGASALAIEKAQQALMIYPQLLRAITFIGVTFAQNGNPRKAADVLKTAARLYPEDAKAEFALASVLSLMGDQTGAATAYKQVISLEADFTAAYVNLGTIFYSSGDWRNAVSIFRRGLQIDPMSSELYYGLSLALTKGGDAIGAAEAATLASKLEPGILKRKGVPR